MMNDLIVSSNLAKQVQQLGGTSSFWHTNCEKSSILLTSSGMCVVGNEIVVAQRKLHNISGDISGDWRANWSEVLLSKLDLNQMQLRPIHTITLRDECGINSLEDPRLHWNNEQLELWCSTWKELNSKLYIQQIVLSLDHNFEVTKSEIPDFGNNKIGGPEKNWCPISNTSNFIYSASNTHIVCDNNTGEVFTSKGISWEFGDPHGGTPALLVDDEYLCFFQSSLPVNKESLGQSKFYPRQYFIGAYTFESKPPFQITGYTTKPIIVGSIEDYGVPGASIITFPAGIVYLEEEQQFLISIAVNETKSGWMKLPKSSVEDQICPVSTQAGIQSDGLGVQ